MYNSYNIMYIICVFLLPVLLVTFRIFCFGYRGCGGVSMNPNRPFLPDSLQWVWSSPLIKPEEQARLVKLAQKGDRKAADALVRSMARSILKLAMQRSGGGANLEELFAAGMLGMFMGIKRYRDDRGANIHTFSVINAKGYMASYLRSHNLRTNRQTSMDEMLPAREVSDEPTQEQILIRKDMQRHIRGIVNSELKKVKPHERDIIKARYGSEETPALRAMVNSKTTTAGGINYIARKTLKKIKTAIESDPDFDPDSIE